jgi:RNA polymerase sigma factor (sigma-70 family)
MQTNDVAAETAEVDIARLVAAARGGDQAAWNTLVERYNRFVWSIARSFRLSTADAGDAVQMTWLRLVENLDRITEPDRLASWLGTTVRRECLQHLRRSSRDRSESGADYLFDVPDGAPPVETALLESERDRALWRAMGMLGSKCQQLLRVLMASPPPAYTEVAAALEMPIGSIGPARKRCLAQLKRIVIEDGAIGEIPKPREGS